MPPRPSAPSATLILIGGVATDAGLWADQLRALGDLVECRPVTPDGETIEASAETILATAPERFAVAGHSMGGYVALALQRMAPQRVERIALIGTGAAVEQPAQREARLALVEMVRTRGYEALIARLVPAMVGPEARANAPLMQRLETMVRDAGADRFIRQQLAVMTRPDAGPGLVDIDVPALVLAGREDRVVPSAQGAALAEAIASARFQLIDRCGHIAPVEQPQAVSDHLRAWLGA